MNQLGNYEIIKALGQGGFATVYLGKHIHLGSFAAIKVLHGDYASSHDLEKFRREAKTVSALEHRNIVRVLDFGVEEGVAFLVMPYAPFGSLRAQYGANTVPLDAVVSYVRQMAGALDYAHRHQVIHRDVKPENMLIDKDAQILLSDFGMALLASASQRTKDDLGGTAAYMAPEQLQGKPQPASDQYALAVTVYEWITGTWPFVGQNLEIIAQSLNSPVPSMRNLIPNLDVEVDKVVLRALLKNPARRFSSVGEFAKALEEVVGVSPRLPVNEHFRSLGGQGGMRSNVERSDASREFASVPTIVRPASRKETGTVVRGVRISRRAVLLGVGGLFTLGGIGLGIEAMQRSGSNPPDFHASEVTPTATRRVNPTLTAKPTERPTAKPTQAPPAQEEPSPGPIQEVPTQRPVPATGTLVFSYHQGSTVFTVAWSPDGSKIASGGTDKTVTIWNAANGNIVTSYFHAASVTYVAWSPDGTKIASASDDGTVRICSSRDGSNLTVYNSNYGNVHSVAWSPDGTRLASGSNTTLYIWSLVGNTLTSYTGHTATIWGVAWSPQGTRIASASGNAKATQADNTVQVWDLNSDAIEIYRGHTSTVFYVSWFPDGSKIASGSADGTVQVWDATTGSVQRIYSNHSGTVYGVAWSPDGTRLASGGVDGTVVVWNIRNGAYTYQGHSSAVYGVAWSPDGTKIASASDDGTVQVWYA